MTREEAIRHLKWIRENGHTENYLNEKEALEMAIKALEQEPCDVCKYNPPSSGDGKPCTMCPAGSEDKE